MQHRRSNDRLVVGCGEVPQCVKQVRQDIDRYPEHHETLREYRCCRPALLDKLCGNARRAECESRGSLRLHIYARVLDVF